MAKWRRDQIDYLPPRKKEATPGKIARNQYTPRNRAGKPRHADHGNAVVAVLFLALVLTTCSLASCVNRLDAAHVDHVGEVQAMAEHNLALSRALRGLP